MRYGKDPSLPLTAKGISKTYTKTDMCGPPASFTSFFRNPGYIHDVLLTNLTASSDYFYSYGSFKVRCWLQVPGLSVLNAINRGLLIHPSLSDFMPSLLGVVLFTNLGLKF